MTTQANGNQDEFAFEDWLAEGIKGMRAKSRQKKDRLVPEEFRVHMKTARKEFLLAFKTLVDAAMARIDEEPEPPKKVTKVKVE